MIPKPIREDILTQSQFSLLTCLAINENDLQIFTRAKACFKELLPLLTNSEDYNNIRKWTQKKNY